VRQVRPADDRPVRPQDHSGPIRAAGPSQAKGATTSEQRLIYAGRCEIHGWAYEQPAEAECGWANDGKVYLLRNLRSVLAAIPAADMDDEAGWLSVVEVST
jgi:hypothetical protein